jgi:hypothetical protein
MCYLDWDLYDTVYFGTFANLQELAASILYPEDGGSMFVRSVCNHLTYYVVSNAT